jgi:hypothetical protein
MRMKSRTKKKMTLVSVAPTRVSGLNTAPLLLAIIAEQAIVSLRTKTHPVPLATMPTRTPPTR